MPIKRLFLDWTKPGLPAAVDYFVREFGSPGEMDLSGVIVAVPGGRVQRRLLELLVDRCEQDNRRLRPPRIVTVGHLPELLYERKRPFADNFVQQLAWVDALKQSPAEELRLLVLSPPEQDDLAGWLGLGSLLGRLHRELAADNLNFADVARCGARLEGFCESARWDTLARVQEKYLGTLDAVELWDLQTARLVAIRQRECRCDKQIVLVGTVDLNRAQRLMLDQVAECVTALVFAPEALADHFDAHGGLRPDAWQEVRIGIDDGQIEVVGDPEEQAAAAVRAIAALDGKYCAEQITVGVPDEQVVPYLQQQFAECDLKARYGPGTPVTRTAPCRLLAAVADHLDRPQFATLAALARHPSVADWLVARNVGGDWLTSLDNYYCEHFPERLDGQWLGERGACQRLGRMFDELNSLLGDLRPGRRPLNQWSQAILDLLARAFATRSLAMAAAADRAVLDGCEAIRDALQSHATIPADLMPAVSAAEAIRLVLQQAGAETVAPPADRTAIELLGWLELPLDDAAVLIVTGMNDGIVPSALNGDLFLPNQLRRALDVEDNHRRYARDAYALSAIAASRERLKLIAGRRTMENDPLIPSRLLFACERSVLAGRALAIFKPRESKRTRIPAAGMQPAAKSMLQVPMPRPLGSPVTSMKVTEFRDYLACPYRYYLRHRLKLTCVDDSAEELDALRFGSLVHDVLKAFGQSELAASTNLDDVRGLLDALLDGSVRSGYGESPLPVIRIQAEQLRARLAAFARWQVNWADQGWRIECVERDVADGQASLVVDGQPMYLRGRIDRIDVNGRDGRRMIFDYKSSAAARPPEKTHRDADGWIDLQLPLYRHLARGMGIDGPVGLGYIVLPNDIGAIGHLEAPWRADELTEADAVAADVVRKVRAEKFWPPASPPPAFFDEFAAICHDEQYGPLVLADAESGGSDDA